MDGDRAVRFFEWESDDIVNPVTAYKLDEHQNDGKTSCTDCRSESRRQDGPGMTNKEADRQQAIELFECFDSVVRWLG